MRITKATRKNRAVREAFLADLYEVNLRAKEFGIRVVPKARFKRIENKLMGDRR